MQARGRGERYGRHVAQHGQHQGPPRVLPRIGVLGVDLVRVVLESRLDLLELVRLLPDVDEVGRQLLTTPDSVAVGALADAMVDAEIPATTQDLAQWFRFNLDNEVTILSNPPHLPDDLPGDGDNRGARGKAEGSLHPLVAAGFLPSGTELTLRRGATVVIRGVVDEVGWIVVDGVTYRAPSDEAFAQAPGRQSLNGWREWQAELPSGALSLDALGQRLSATTEWEAGTR